MTLNRNSSPDTTPDDQAYDVPAALDETARNLNLDSSQHRAVADFFKEHNTDEDLVEEEATRGLEFLSRIKQLRWAAKILRITNTKK